MQIMEKEKTKKVLFFQVQSEIGFNVTEYARKYF